MNNCIVDIYLWINNLSLRDFAGCAINVFFDDFRCFPFNNNIAFDASFESKYDKKPKCPLFGRVKSIGSIPDVILIHSHLISSSRRQCA